jgi:hypothetical protein
VTLKRDLELVREILLRLEPLDAHYAHPVPLKIGEGPLKIDGYSNEAIAYHLRIMTEGGLIANNGIMDDNLTLPGYLGFNWLGHEFLDDVRDPKRWETLKGTANKLGGVGMGVLMDLAKAYARLHGVPV